MHYSDKTFSLVRTTRRRKLANLIRRNAHRKPTVLILACALGTAAFSLTGTANAADVDSSASHEAPPRISANDAPPAAPQERPPALTVPIGPEKDVVPDLPAPPEEVPAAPSESSPGQTPFLDDPTLLNPANVEGTEIADVRVVGNRVVPTDNVLLRIKGTQPGAKFSIRQAEADRLSIMELGFFASTQYQISPNLNNPDLIDVTFVVVENRVATDFRIEGNKLIDEKDILAVLTSEKGAVLNNQSVSNDSKAIQNLYRERGLVGLVTDIRQEDDGTTVFVIQEGNISRIEITGLKKTNESIVRGLIATKPGDPFDEKKIQKDLNRIYDTGFFEDVTYKVDDDRQQPGALIITVSVKEKRTGQLSLGIGFDNRSKISGYASVGDNNFRGSGRNVSAEVQLGSVRGFRVGMGDSFVGKNNASYSVSLYSMVSFLEPKTVNLVTGNPTSFDYQQRRTGGRVNYTMPLNFEHRTNILFGYRNEKIKLSQYRMQGDPEDLPSIDEGRVSAASIGFLHDTRDLHLDPSHGGREMFIVERGFSFLGGDRNFTKLDLDLRRYVPLMKGKKPSDSPRLVLAGRVVWGHALGSLPAFEQYFIGGTDTVRGYDTDSQFGKNQLFGNLELRYRVNNKFQLVAFGDIGSAYGGSTTPYKNFDAMTSVGGGIRLQTPIGPIRLDIGFGSDGSKTHFGIGSTF